MLYIDEQDYLPNVTPSRLDLLLANGWRHFGPSFFRYSLTIDRGEIRRVIPLRIRLADFSLSRSQKRILARNRDTELIIRPTTIDQEKEAIFDRHKERFTANVPDSIRNFLSPRPATIPCRNDELCVCHEDRLIAVSFLDIGALSASAVYAIFEPAESARSLGIYLILRGIDYAKQLNLKYYYPGYAYRERSFYDYKKRFSGLEAYDWNQGWQNYTEETE